MFLYFERNISWDFDELAAISLSLSHCITVFVSISSLKAMVSNSFPQAYRTVSSAKLQISVSFMKRRKSLIRTCKRISPNIDPDGTLKIIIWSIHLRTSRLLPVVFSAKDNFVLSLNCFCQLRMSLALQLSNHGWHSHKLLISPLIMFQQFPQTHQDTFAIFREGLWGHIEYCTLS